MNKTISINISGIIFNIEEDAYKALRDYIDALKLKLQNEEGGDEIISDIESRIAELFQEKLNVSKNVILKKDLDEVIALLGDPDTYLDSEDEKESATRDKSKPISENRRIYRDLDDKLVGGVASGLSHFLGIDPLILRILFVLALFSGFGFLFYIILWIVVPAANTTSEKLRMRKKKINVQNIFSQSKTDFLKESTSSVVEKILDAIRQILNAIGTILRYVFGVLFLIWAVVLVVGCLSAIFGISVLVDNVYLMSFNEIRDVYVPHTTGFAIGMSGLLIIVIGFILLFLKLGISLLKKSKGPFQFVFWLFPVLIIIGTILLSAGVTFNLIPFSDSREVSTSTMTQWSDGDTISLSFNDPFAVELFKDDYDNDIFDSSLIKDDVLFNTRVTVCYRPTTENELYIEVIRESNGETHLSALTNAEHIVYDISIDSVGVYFPPYLGFPTSDRYRNQQVTVNMYIPSGVVIIPDKSVQNKFTSNRHKSIKNDDGSLILMDSKFKPLSSDRYTQYVYFY